MNNFSLLVNHIVARNFVLQIHDNRTVTKTRSFSRQHFDGWSGDPLVAYTHRVDAARETSAGFA